METKAVCGANEVNVSPGVTVDEIRRSHGDVLNVPDGAQAYVNGQVVAGDYVIKDGESVQFNRTSGSKG